jgi:hypothetical protein
MVLGSMAELVGLPVSKDHDNFDIYMKLGGFSYTTIKKKKKKKKKKIFLLIKFVTMETSLKIL